MYFNIGDIYRCHIVTCYALNRNVLSHCVALRLRNGVSNCAKIKRDLSDKGRGATWRMTHVQQSSRGCVTSRAEVKADPANTTFVGCLFPFGESPLFLPPRTIRYNTSQRKFAVGMNTGVWISRNP